jgi:hypothetical protein
MEQPDTSSTFYEGNRIHLGDDVGYPMPCDEFSPGGDAIVVAQPFGHTVD